MLAYDSGFQITNCGQIEFWQMSQEFQFCSMDSLLELLLDTNVSGHIFVANICLVFFFWYRTCLVFV